MTTRSLALMPLVLLLLARPVRLQPDAAQVYVLTGPEHTMEQLQKACAEMPPVRSAPGALEVPAENRC
jgi:hypothetical protein